MSRNLEILVATSAGICFGVERALRLSEKAVSEKQGPLYSMGPIIHNPQTVQDFSKRGLSVAENLDEVEGTVIFRSHGVTKEVMEASKAKNLKIVDATCPLVKVPQNFARKLSDAGYFVIIVGDAKHPEVQGVKSYVSNGEVAVIKTSDEVASLPLREKVGVICQTTLKKSVFDGVVEAAQLKYKEVKVHNTICSATKDRQEAALELSRQVDLVLVIGGRNSSNTQKLFEICRDNASQAYLIETEAEIQREWLSDAKRVGITAGASTPHEAIDRVRAKIESLSI